MTVSQCDSPKAIARPMYSPVSRSGLIGVETPFHPITTWDCKYVPLKHTHMVKLQHYKRRHIQASEFPFTFLPVWPNKDCFQNLSQNSSILRPRYSAASNDPPQPQGRGTRSFVVTLRLRVTIKFTATSSFNNFTPPSKSQQNIWPQIVTNKKSAQSYHLRRARIAV